MNDVVNGIYAGETAKVVGGLFQGFIAGFSDDVVALRPSVTAGADMTALRQFAFEVRGQARNFGFSAVDLIASRMVGYLEAINAVDQLDAENLCEFLDAFEWAIDEGVIGGDVDLSELVRRLPARRGGMDLEDIEIRNVEVMLVMLPGTQSRIIEKELSACGYRVNVVASTIWAIPEAVRARPDMMIVSAVMPDLSGIDLVIALNAMPETRNIPVALITSLDRGDERLGLLPATMPIIRKNGYFGDDLAAALESNFLL